MNCLLLSQIQELQHQDAFCTSLITTIQQGQDYDNIFSVKQDLLWHDGKIVVPESGNHKQQLLQEYNASKLGGIHHNFIGEGSEKMYMILLRNV